MNQAIIVFAHGSRDPLWHQPMQAVAERIRAKSPQTTVRCAYLELTTPDLASTAAELVGLGVTSVQILPMFLGVGRHAREDLPRLVADLRQAHPQLQVTLMPSVGEDPRVVELLATLALGTDASEE